MLNQKKISRRAFVLGLSFGSICEAAIPLINLNQKQPSLINFQEIGIFLIILKKAIGRILKVFILIQSQNYLTMVRKQVTKLKHFTTSQKEILTSK